MALSTDPMGMEEGRDLSGYEGLGKVGPDLPSGWDPTTRRGKTGVSSIGYEKKEQSYEKWGRIIGAFLGMLSPIPGGVLIGAAIGRRLGQRAARATLSQSVAKETGATKETVDRVIDIGIKSGVLNVSGDKGGDQIITVIGEQDMAQDNYGNWWENTAGPISVGGGPGMRMPGGGTWIRTEDGRQYFMTPEMLSPGYNGPIAWAGGKYTLPSDPDDPRNAEYVKQQQGAATGDITGTITDPSTGYAYPANTMSSPLMADPKTDTWNNFLDSYFGIKPTDEDPGVPSYLDRVLRDVTFKQDEGKEFLDRLNQISQETVSGLQPYSAMLKKQVESTRPIGLSFGGTPMASFISRPDREVGKDYNAVIQQIAAAKKDPANVRFGMADMMSPEKGYIDYIKNYENLIRLALNKEAIEKELAIKQQEVEQKETDFSWIQAAKDIIDLGSSGYDLYKTIFA
uniref:Uncharacterized protein n=1 Tax=viral metagenome TaxID=1070528 RepID=A0A6M3IM69_9ZZZZ